MNEHEHLPACLYTCLPTWNISVDTNLWAATMLMSLSECLLLHIYNGGHTNILLLDMASCGADIDAEPLGLLPAKGLKTNDWTKCLICQVEKKEILRKASATGIIALLAASNQRRRDEVFERIERHADQLQTRDVVWHGTCYGPYTNSRNLSFIPLIDHPSVAVIVMRLSHSILTKGHPIQIHVA